MKRKVLVDKTCVRCGVRFNRRRLQGGRLEDVHDYERRKWCSRQCYWADKDKTRECLRSPNTIDVFGETAHIRLSKGYVAFIDTEDAPRAAARTWYACLKKGRVYAASKRSGESIVYLHRFVLGMPNCRSIDHINGDGLDNRKANLRSASYSQQVQHKLRRRQSVNAPYRGIGRVHSKGRIYARFYARIRVDGRQIHLGVFASPEEAAETRDDAARRLHGPFAVLNFPKEGEQGHEYLGA